MLKMNLPNKLTMLRIILVPVFVIFMCFPVDWIWNMWAAFGVFVIAALTDMIDGQISRKKGLVTKFGKIMDPLADKLLISSGFIMLTSLHIVPGYITAIIIFRDFFVNALRMFGTDKGSDLAADISGKIKTIFELVGVSLGILSLTFGNITPFLSFITSADLLKLPELFINIGMSITVVGATLATVWSFVTYLIRFKKDVNVEE